jgi:site-specific DNA-methyltransferase (adenine-specific)
MTTPHFRFLRGDCLQVIPEKTDAGFCKLAIVDSPYNMGKSYSSYHDDKPSAEFRAWLEQRLAAALKALHSHGTMVVFLPDEWAADFDVWLRNSMRVYRQSWLIWSFGFGVACQKNFSRSHCHILRYTKAKTRFTFNADAVRVPSDRQLVYGDKRAAAKGKLPNDTWLLTKEQIDKVLPSDGDVWYESRICGSFHERREHSPNQIPLPIMERIVLACSDPGDWVLDPFSGTFTTGVACKLHNRSFIGIDIDETCVKQGMERVKSATT